MYRRGILPAVVSESPTSPSAHAGPEVARLELVLRLRKRRAELQIDTSTIIQALGISRGRWSQIENDHTMIAANAIPLLQEPFGYGDHEIEQLKALRAAAADRRQAWWLGYAELLGPELLKYYGLEHGASRMRWYSPAIMIGHLQTEEYARALIGHRADVSRGDVARFWTVRQRRQERFRSGRVSRIEVLLTEAVLRNELGSPAILRRQLLHLVEQIEEMPDRLQVRVLPFSAPPSTVITGSIFSLLDFESEHLPTLAWQESIQQMGLFDDEDTVGFLELTYAEATELALDRESSLERILSAAEELG